MVRDEYQHRGLGIELLRRLIQVARAEQLDSVQAYMLRGEISYHKRDLAGTLSVKLAQPSDGEDFMLARIWHCVISDDRNIAVVVEKTDSSQPVMSHALAELGQLKITKKHAAFGKRFVKLHHEWLIFGAHRPQSHGCAIFHCPKRNILHWVGSEMAGLGRSLVAMSLSCRTKRAYKSDDLIGGSDPGIDVGFLDRGIFYDEAAEAF